MRKTEMKKGLSIIAVLVAISLFAFSGVLQAKELVLKDVPVRVYFSTYGGCTEAIVRELNQTKNEILVQASSFTSKPIAHAIAHNKILIIDRKIVITGSFDLTRAAAEKNAENLLIIRSTELAREYLESWERHREHSEVYGGR